MQTALPEVLEAETAEALGAEKGERTPGRQGYRSGYYERVLITRIGKLELLRMPQDRAGRFSTELFGRYQRSERALVPALAELSAQGVSTRKNPAPAKGSKRSPRNCAATASRLDDGAIRRGRPLAEAFPYLLDARYERVREADLIDHWHTFPCHRVAIQRQKCRAREVFYLYY